MSLIAKYNVRATFFLSGVRAEKHPDLLKAYVDNGHDIYGHGWEHIMLNMEGPERLLADLKKIRSVSPTISADTFAVSN